VKGEEYKVVDIPPGYTHSIENVGSGDLVTLFWASEIFDPDRPDTLFDPVTKQGKPA
jgi:UDP-2-acetamido-2,6-beta-L-arabino-hexul-4-ose reductase